MGEEEEEKDEAKSQSQGAVKPSLPFPLSFFKKLILDVYLFRAPCFRA